MKMGTSRTFGKIFEPFTQAGRQTAERVTSPSTYYPERYPTRQPVERPQIKPTPVTKKPQIVKPTIIEKLQQPHKDTLGFQEQKVRRAETNLTNLEQSYRQSGRISPTGEFISLSTAKVEKRWSSYISGQQFTGSQEQFRTYKREWETAQQTDKTAYTKYQSTYEKYEKEIDQYNRLQSKKQKELKEYITYPVYEKAHRFGRWWEKKIVPKGLKPETPAYIKPLATFGIGVTRSPGQMVTFVGTAPSAVEYGLRDADEFTASVIPGAIATSKGMVKHAKEEPLEFAGEVAGTAILTRGVVKGVKLTPKLSPFYRGRVSGVRPFTGEPKFFNKLLLGEKPHPTPKGKMKVLLKEDIFKGDQPYYHGTSMGFVKQITKRGKTVVSPEAVGVKGMAGVERSLFFSAPKQPYLRFAIPGRFLKIGKGAKIREIPINTLERMMAGKLSSSQLKNMGILKVKPSAKLKKLFAERKALERNLAQLEKKPLSKISLSRRATESKIYDISRKIEKRVGTEYGKATGKHVRLVDEPGAFLEWETRPVKPSKQIIKKAFRREELRGLEKAGKISQIEKIELRKLEAILKKETLREYFDLPEGKLYPSPKPMMGYEWKGIPELEYVTRPGTRLYPLTSVRTKFYEKFGITKGTEFTYDPITGRYVDILKLTTKRPTTPVKSKPLVDIPRLVEPLKKPKKITLSKTSKAKITRLKRDIAKAERINDFETATRLSNEIRRIEYGKPRRYPPVALSRVDGDIRQLERPTRRDVIREDISRIDHQTRAERRPPRSERRFEQRYPIRDDVHRIERQAREDEKIVRREPRIQPVRRRDVISEDIEQIDRIIHAPHVDILIPPIARITTKPKPKDKERRKLTIEEQDIEDIYRKRKYPTLTPEEILDM